MDEVTKSCYEDHVSGWCSNFNCPQNPNKPKTPFETHRLPEDEKETPFVTHKLLVDEKGKRASVPEPNLTMNEASNKFRVNLTINEVTKPFRVKQPSRRGSSRRGTPSERDYVRDVRQRFNEGQGTIVPNSEDLNDLHSSNPQVDMLKVPENQVAGHQAIDGRLGPLIDDSGFFYKPLQSDSRGTNEVAFYESFSSDTRIPDHIRRFFPVSHGTKLIEASDGSGLQTHLVMEDINFGRIKPSVLDVKIGSRTWYPQASEDYIAKCVKKDRETSTLGLGFRLSGLQIYKDKELGFWKPGKKAVQHLSAKEVKSVLKKFVSSNASEELNSIPDCAFASIVYGGSKGILSQLLELKAWFEDQTIFHFYSCSILVMFEKERAIKDMDPVAQIKLVDFAHVLEGEGVIDHNFLGGLCSLIKFVSEILTSPDECTSEACSEEEEVAQNSSLHLSNGKV